MRVSAYGESSTLALLYPQGSGVTAPGSALGRMGDAEEIGHAAVYLSTAKYVTGDTLIVDGGEWLYKPPLVPREMVSSLSRKVEAKSRSQAPRAKL